MLNVVVLDHDLLIVTFDVSLELLEYAHLQLLIIINTLRDPVDRVLESSDIAVVLADVRSSLMDSFLHLLLLQA